MQIYNEETRELEGNTSEIPESDVENDVEMPILDTSTNPDTVHHITWGRILKLASESILSSGQTAPASSLANATVSQIYFHVPSDVEADVEVYLSAINAANWFAIGRLPRGRVATIADLQRESDARIQSDNTLGQAIRDLQTMTANTDFIIADFRSSFPIPPLPSDTEAVALANKTIGIGSDGVLWTLKSTAHRDPTATWRDFDNTHWEFEQTQPLPRAALETGDFYYIYTVEKWYLFNGTSVAEYDDVDTFLPDHHFLGNFPTAQAAANAITNYDANTTYLAYFPTVVEGRSGREVQQLTSYTPGFAGVNQWVSSDTNLHHLITHIEAEIQDEGDRITSNRGLIHELEITLRTKLDSDAVDARIAAQSPPVGDRSITKNGDIGVGTTSDFAGDYVLRMDAPHPKIADANRVDITILGDTIHTETSWTNGNLLVPFTISDITGIKFRDNLALDTESVEFQVSFYTDDTYIDIIRIAFGVGPEYVSESGVSEARITTIANERAAARYTDAEKAKLAALRSGGGASIFQRSERVNIEAKTGLNTTEQALVATTVQNVFGTGAQEILSADPSGGNFTVLKSGIYLIRLSGAINIGSGSQGRVKASVGLYAGNTLLGRLTDRYHRAASSNNRSVAAGTFIEIPADNTVVSLRIFNEIPGGADFSLDASSIVFGQMGVKGDQGVQGRFEVAIYRNVSGAIPSTVPTGGTFTYATGVLSNLPTGWSLTRTTPATGQRTIESVAVIDYGTQGGASFTPTWSAPVPITGEKGDKGDAATGISQA